MAKKIPDGMRVHDHHDCVARVLEKAARLGEKPSVKMTPVRLKTLEIMLESHKALGAYEIAERLAAVGLGSQPVVAYRALEFLMEHGFVHKIEGLNAFVACAHSDEEHSPVFMVCDECHTVAEAQEYAPQGGLKQSAAAVGFHIHKTIVEAHGLCSACAK